MLSKVVVIPDIPPFSASQMEAREAPTQIQGHLLGSFGIYVFGHLLNFITRMVLGFLPNSSCLPWPGHQGLSLEGRGEHTLCHFFFFSVTLL